MLRRNFISVLLAGALATAVAFSDAPSYYPAAIGDFGGSADYLSLGSDLAGNADGKQGILSCQIRLDGGNGSQLNLVANANARFYIVRNNSNKIQIVGRLADGTVKLNIQSVSTYTSSTSWLHILASWNLAGTEGWLYVADAEDAQVVTALDAEIDYTRTVWTIAANHDGTTTFNGAVSGFYLNLATYLDLSVEDNRRLFISAAGHPVPLGANGSLPTDTAPIIYMRERANNSGLNSGTGGDFTINGAPLYTEGPVPFFPFTTLTPGVGRGSMGSRIH